MAETLITLTVLGIVAVIGISFLVQSYKKSIIETKIKTAYSIISNIIELSEVDNGPGNKWDWNYPPSSYSFFSKYILPYLPSYTHYFFGGTGNGYQAVSGDSNYYSNGVAKINCLNGGVLYTNPRSHLLAATSVISLKNGMDMIIKVGSPGDIFGVYFYVDINGLRKGNNTIGKEIFVFVYDVKASGCCTASNIRRNIRANLRPGASRFLYNNDLTVNEALSSSTPGGCNKQSSMSGLWCSYVIYKNGWKIPNNYPVKKF